MIIATARTISVHRTSMISNPNQYIEGSYPKSPKRKSDAMTMQPSRLQTANLDTPGFRQLRNSSIDDTLSPRAAVSARLQGLHLQNSSSPTGRSARGSLWSMDQDSEEGPALTLQQLPRETPVPTSNSTTTNAEKNESNEAEATISLKHDMELAIFQFKAGGTTHTAAESEPRTALPFKRTAFAVEDDKDQTMSSPSKRQRRASPTVSPSPQPIPRSMSPSARKLSHRSPPASEISSSPSEAELAQHWWQPSEIVGHDPDDPEEDNRGVNGIGYQKTKAEQWRISEKKKRQLAEWRSREAKEARSLRAGGRRVIMGRISKSGSRAGSPSDGTTPIRGRSSPTPRSVSDEKRMEEVVRRAVRFEL